jgi:hypothetical protein
MVTWHKMFSREVRLREAMKRIIAVMWSHDVAPGATGYTANDIIIGIESGELLYLIDCAATAAVAAAAAWLVKERRQSAGSDLMQFKRFKLCILLVTSTVLCDTPKQWYLTHVRLSLTSLDLATCVR